MKQSVYGILDFEKIWDMARHLIYHVLTSGAMLNDNGDYEGFSEEKGNWFQNINSNPKVKYLNFRECEELHGYTMAGADELTTEAIREKYLSDTLPFLRNVMRKGSLTPYEAVSEDVPDGYLDEIICMAWKVDLLIWAKSWEEEKQSN